MDYPVLDARATGARIKELRKARHLTVEDVAGFMGFESEQAVYKWQRGDSLPTVDNLYALSRLFGTTVDDILVGSIERDESPSFSVLGGIPKPISFKIPESFSESRAFIWQPNVTEHIVNSLPSFSDNSLTYSRHFPMK